jgi:hypothetical protein
VLLINRLTEIGRCYAMEMKVEETKVMRISGQLSAVQIMIDQKQLENVDYFNYLGNMVGNDARCTPEIKSRVTMAKAAFRKHCTLSV